MAEVFSFREARKKKITQEYVDSFAKAQETLAFVDKGLSHSIIPHTDIGYSFDLLKLDLKNASKLFDSKQEMFDEVYREGVESGYFAMLAKNIILLASQLDIAPFTDAEVGFFERISLKPSMIAEEMRSQVGDILLVEPSIDDSFDYLYKLGREDPQLSNLYEAIAILITIHISSAPDDILVDEHYFSSADFKSTLPKIVKELIHNQEKADEINKIISEKYAVDASGLGKEELSSYREKLAEELISNIQKEFSK